MKTKKIITGIACLMLLLVTGVSWWWVHLETSTVLRQVSFDELPGWKSAHLQKSLLTFQTSCRVFLKQDPDKLVGTDSIVMQVKDWRAPCEAALDIDPITEKSAQAFFETWFSPVEFYNRKPVKGLFTGYYLPLVKGSYTESEDYSVPIYTVPRDLISIDLAQFAPQYKNTRLFGRLEGSRLVPYYTREQIDKGAIKDKAQVLLWLNNPIDRLFLEIQGSGIVELEDGKRVFVGYDGQNGAPYTSVAAVLIRKGVMTRDTASMQLIQRYLHEHPEERDAIINQNHSFVFFRKLSLEAALGAQGVALTPGYSLAIDREWIPMGMPLWLSTSVPNSHNPALNNPLHRLMVAQDTGGAIRGKVRGDVYWGGGNKASVIAGHMKNEGHYWLLIPHNVVSRLSNSHKP